MIKQLTLSQIDQFPRYVDKWLKIGLSTGDCDFEKAKVAAVSVYESAGLNAPKHFYIFDSPLSAAIGAKFLISLYQNLVVSGFDKMGDRVRTQVGDRVRYQVWAQVGIQVRAQVGTQVGDRVWDQVRTQVRDQVWDQVGIQVRDQVWDQVGTQVRDQVRDQVWDQVWGNHDANWLAFYDFFLNECGVISCEKLRPLMELAKYVGWWAPYENVCIFQHKPDHIKFDVAKLLHCENGPAIKYRDGFSVYAWHGVRVPAEWIEDKDNLNPADVLKCENVEQRAAGASIIGWPKMLDHLDHKIVASNVNPQIGDLIEVRLPGLSEPELYLKFLCPRNGEMMEAINKRELAKTDLHHAHAWHANIPPHLYSTPNQRS